MVGWHFIRSCCSGSDKFGKEAWKRGETYCGMFIPFSPLESDVCCCLLFLHWKSCILFYFIWKTYYHLFPVSLLFFISVSFSGFFCNLLFFSMINFTTSNFQSSQCLHSLFLSLIIVIVFLPKFQLLVGNYCKFKHCLVTTLFLLFCF